MIEENKLQGSTARTARNYGVATDLQGRTILSPFAVAITVMAMRSFPDLITSDRLLYYMNQALKACEDHVRDAHLVDPMPRDTKIVVQANHVGGLLKFFVINAVALRLQSLLEASKLPYITASELFPPSQGMLCRPLSSSSTSTPLLLSIVTDPDAELPRLFTQTGALLLPSPVSSTQLGPRTIDQSVSIARHLYESTEYPTMENVAFSYLAITVAPANFSPTRFPVIRISPHNDVTMHHNLVRQVSSPQFLPRDFTRSSSQREVRQTLDDMLRVVDFALYAVEYGTALLFNPTDNNNRMCDTVMILPTYDLKSQSSRRAISFVFLAMNGHNHRKLDASLDDIQQRFTLLITPTETALQQEGVSIDFCLYLCAGCNPVQIQPRR